MLRQVSIIDIQLVERLKRKFLVTLIKKSVKKKTPLGNNMHRKKPANQVTRTILSLHVLYPPSLPSSSSITSTICQTNKPFKTEAVSAQTMPLPPIKLMNSHFEFGEHVGRKMVATAVILVLLTGK